MKKLNLLPLLLLLSVLAGLTYSCVDDSHLRRIDDPVANFEQLWKTLDEHYCFFEEKGINWDSVYMKYRPLVKDDTEYVQLFSICAAMLDELKD